MVKVRNPIRFSDHFGFDENLLGEAGVLNPTLTVDTKLFIDPFLLVVSRHPEIRDASRPTYEEHFNTVIKLLRVSQRISDTPWRNAYRLLQFPEIKWTCLGYGASSVSGSGSGKEMTDQVIQTAKEIVDLGVEDPDLFVAMALFEDGFGPDLISDMTTNVILDNLLNFTARVLKTLPVPHKKKTLVLRNGKTYEASLPVNPYVKGNPPIVLVPADILRALPIATDWSDVADAASHNAALRRRVNKDIADIWKVKTLKDKDKIRRWALSGKDAFENFLEMIRGPKPTPYNLADDPLGEIFWRKLAAMLTATPIEDKRFALIRPPRFDLDGVASVVEQIIEQFQFLIVERRLSEELYYGKKPRPEKAAQRLFFAVAYAFCKANNLDITPEADTGNGPVDFKVSLGFSGRVLVEVKLSTNKNLVKGYSRQLETYKTAEETVKGYYVVLDVGGMGNKGKNVIALKNEANARREPTSEIVFIDGMRRPSASKL